jgi:hypothetical protein
VIRKAIKLPRVGQRLVLTPPKITSQRLTRPDILARTYISQNERIILMALGRGNAMLSMSRKPAASLKAKLLP